MKIYLCRHAYAGEYLAQAEKVSFKHDPKDMARPLEPEGIAAATALGQWLTDNDEAPTRILHSPVKRAKQTAQILGRSLGIKPEENPNLSILKPAEMVIKALAADKSQKRVVIVAHSDNIPPALRALNWLSGADKYAVDPYAMAEMRILDIDRDSLTWSERGRVLPSDIGQDDFY